MAEEQQQGQQMSMEQLVIGLHNHVGILTEVLVEKGVLTQEDLMNKAKQMQEKAVAAQQAQQTQTEEKKE